MRATPRRPFPPNTNDPWTYRPEYEGEARNYDQPLLDADAVVFSMTQTLLALSVSGILLGLTIGRFVWILPTWLVAIILGAGVAYVGTLQDSYGDLFR